MTSMTSLFGRSTLYDMLTCLIPGYCILFFLHFAQFIREIVNIDSTSIVITLFVLSYIVGLIYKHLVFYFTDNEFRNNPVNIRKAYFLAEIQHKKPIPLTDNGLLETYYMAYYNAVKENGNSSIPTLEAQIAFLREIPILIILEIGTFVGNLAYSDVHILKTGDAFFLLFLYVIYRIVPHVAENIQLRLHKLVWEDDYFVNKLNKKQKDK